MSAQPGAPPYLFTQAGTFDGPFVFNVPASLEVQPTAATATFDGTGASGDFIACLSFYAQSGELLSRVYPQTPVTAGDVAQISYAPFPGGLAGGGGGGGGGFTGWTEDGSNPANVSSNGGNLDLVNGALTVEAGTVTGQIGGGEIEIGDTSTGEDVIISPGSAFSVAATPAAGGVGFGIHDFNGATAAFDAGALRMINLQPGVNPDDAATVSQATGVTSIQFDVANTGATLQITTTSDTDLTSDADMNIVAATLELTSNGGDTTINSDAQLVLGASTNLELAAAGFAEFIGSGESHIGGSNITIGTGIPNAASSKIQIGSLPGASNQHRIGFYGATEVSQAAHPVTLADVITLLTNLGLCA